MPTYDYRCRQCGTVTEVIHSMVEEGPTACEVCGGRLRRILYPAGIIFKGSGFYSTDSRTGPGEGGSSAGSDAAASGTTDKAKADAAAPSGDKGSGTPKTPSDSARGSDTASSPGSKSSGD